MSISLKSTLTMQNILHTYCLGCALLQSPIDQAHGWKNLPHRVIVVVLLCLLQYPHYHFVFCFTFIMDLLHYVPFHLSVLTQNSKKHRYDREEKKTRKSIASSKVLFFTQFDRRILMFEWTNIYNACIAYKMFWFYQMNIDHMRRNSDKSKIRSKLAASHLEFERKERCICLPQM